MQGRAGDVASWWSVVRNWQWKLVKVRVQEDGEVPDSQGVDGWRSFQGFGEVGVLKDCLRGNHMDMGEFQKFLKEHRADWVFKELFGIDRS